MSKPQVRGLPLGKTKGLKEASCVLCLKTHTHVVYNLSLHTTNLSQNQNDFTIVRMGAVSKHTLLLKKTNTTVSGGSLGSLVEEERS